VEAEAHRLLMTDAIACEAVAHRAALAGELDASRAAFAQAAATYRASWEQAPPTSFGRLVGMLKAAILAGGGIQEATYVRDTLADADARSPTASYAQAIAALALADDPKAAEWAELMRGASPAFVRTATAITALARADDAAYRASLAEIVDDFASREAHLTGVPIADTALMLDVLAGPRGLSGGIDGPLMPRLGDSSDFPRSAPNATERRAAPGYWRRAHADPQSDGTAEVVD
jgi:hypothetical protein